MTVNLCFLALCLQVMLFAEPLNVEGVRFVIAVVMVSLAFFSANFAGVRMDLAADLVPVYGCSRKHFIMVAMSQAPFPLSAIFFHPITIHFALAFTAITTLRQFEPLVAFRAQLR
jgi:hypothetical protein